VLREKDVGFPAKPTAVEKQSGIPINIPAYPARVPTVGDFLQVRTFAMLCAREHPRCLSPVQRYKPRIDITQRSLLDRIIPMMSEAKIAPGRWRHTAALQCDARLLRAKSEEVRGGSGASHPG
jgi:hypothetical protein